MTRRPPRSTRTATLFPDTTLVRSRAAGVEALDLLAPGGHLALLVRCAAALVGDVVDFAAEGVDGIHRLAARARQQAHAPEEGRAGAGRHRAHMCPRGLGARKSTPLNSSR